MFIYQRYDQSIPRDTDAYYEAVVSQEEIYLEEVEEELRAILIFGVPFSSRQVVGPEDAENDSDA